MRTRSQSLLTAAKALSSRFRAEAAEADRLARIPDALFEQIRHSQILEVFLPRRYGGLEAPPLEYKEVIIELSRGDGGMAWAVNLLAQGPWMLKTWFGEEAMEEVFGTQGGARIAQMVAPRFSDVQKVTGGLRIADATWSFNSGVYHANWDILGINLGLQGEQRALVVIPISQVQILNDWNVIGLRGSGSSSVRVRDVFVPEHRVAVGFAADRTDASRLSATDEYWMYLADFVPLASNILTLPIIGMARAMLELFIDQTHRRPILYTTYTDQAHAPVTHLDIGRASAEIDAAELLVHQGIERIETVTRAGGVLSTDERLRMRRDTGFANHLLWEAANRLAAGAGGSFARVSNLLNRFWLDTRIATLHAGLCTHTALEAYGRVQCGLDPATTLY